MTTPTGDRGTVKPRTSLPRRRVIGVVAAIAAAGLVTGLLVAQAMRPDYAPGPSGLSATPSATSENGTVDVTRTRAVAAPDKALFPPNVPYATLISGGSFEGDERLVHLPRLTVQVVDARCDVTKIVEWSRPGGGKYCVVSVALTVKGSEPVTITAINQLVYGMPARKGAPGGYQGTFLLDANKAPTDAITVMPGEQVNALVVFDVQDGFTASQLVPQER